MLASFCYGFHRVMEYYERCCVELVEPGVFGTMEGLAWEKVTHTDSGEFIRNSKPGYLLQLSRSGRLSFDLEYNIAI